MDKNVVRSSASGEQDASTGTFGALLLALALCVGMPSLTGGPVVTRPSISIQIQGQALAASVIAIAPGLSGYVQRLQVRGDHSMERFGWAILDAGLLWLWVILSGLIFVLVAATASVADPRMLALRRIPQLPGDLLRGIRLFLRVVWDRRTPWVARGVILLGLIYWLAPTDLILDEPPIGFIDDVVIAVLVGRAFAYFCPESVVARHAHAVSA